LLAMNPIILHDSAETHYGPHCQESPPLAMGDTGISALCTRYESVRVQSLRQNERTTARDTLQHRRGDYSCCRAVTAGQQEKCTTPSANLTEGGTHAEGRLY
jgi:hypothetical protein